MIAALAAGADIKASPDIPTADTATSAILRLRVFNICFLSKLTKETFSLVSRFIARADESNPTPHSGRGVETWFFGVRNNLLNNIVRWHLRLERVDQELERLGRRSLVQSNWCE